MLLDFSAVTVEKLLLAAPRGYCAGVDRAVQTVERALELHGPPVYVRKEIVHNKHVVARCASAARSSSTSSTTRSRGRDHRLLRPRRVAGGPRRRRAPRPADDRRDLPAGDQGPPRGGQVRRRGLHDRADRPRRPRGGRGHDGRGARPHRARRRPRRTWTARGPRSGRRSPTSPRPRCRSTRRARSSTSCARIPDITGPRTDDICYATTNRQAAVKQMAEQCDLVLVIGSAIRRTRSASSRSRATTAPWRT